MRYLIRHETRLSYSAPVREHHCELRLKPRHDRHQTLLRFKVETEPKAEIFEYVDAFGNEVLHFGILPLHDSLVTRMEAEVETFLENPFDYLPLSSEQELQILRTSLQEDPSLHQFLLHRSPFTPDLKRLSMTELPRPPYLGNSPLQESLLEAMRWMREHFIYRPGATAVDTPLEEFLKNREGVCQDFAQLMISLIRSWGFPARYVMGYQDSGQSQAGGQKTEATHAWTEVWIPGIGWRGIDATHGLMVNDAYIAVAVGRDATEAAPQRGSYHGGGVGGAPEVKIHVSAQQQ